MSGLKSYLTTFEASANWESWLINTIAQATSSGDGPLPGLGDTVRDTSNPKMWKEESLNFRNLMK